MTAGELVTLLLVAVVLWIACLVGSRRARP